MALIGRVDVWPRRVRQGQTVLLRIWSQAAPAASATVENRTIELVRNGDALIGLFGVGRQSRLGPRPVRFTVTEPAGRRIVRTDPADAIEVVDGEFARERLVMDSKALNLLDPARQAQENTTLDRVQGRWTPEKRWRGPWVDPVGNGEPPVPLSSPFGILRSINGGPYTWSHEGTDFRVDAGDPVKAVAGGRVALAQELYVRGNTVVLDHGLGLFSMYNHLQRFDVQPGQEVELGHVIGLVGATGFVTGPHLHLELRLHNQPVEPLEWLGRPPSERPDLAAL
jgi:murein DD-endopeptidase MepM/ murein hydrolase activator NlpD